MTYDTDCIFFEAEPNKWYAILRPKGALVSTDWRTLGDCYGPFKDQLFLAKHLKLIDLSPDRVDSIRNSQFRMDDVWGWLIKKATNK